MGTAVAKLLLLCLSLTIAVNGLSITNPTGAGALYRGKYIGRLQPRQHKVSGEVYAVDARTLHIRGFTYDGTGPDAFFWTGFTESPSPQGIIVPDERGTKEVLGVYNNQDITITLPDGLTLRDIKWFGVWCRAYEVNFGDLYISPDLDFPQPHVIGSLSGQHGVSSGPIVVVDAQTILVPDFVYDGQAPDVHFWTGKGKPGPEGIRIPDETGGDAPLVKSDKKTMVLSLPGDLTIFDIDFFGVWCRLYYVDFGHVKVPQNLNVPPSLRMLGVTPQLSAVVDPALSGPREIIPSNVPLNIHYVHETPQVIQLPAQGYAVTGQPTYTVLGAPKTDQPQLIATQPENVFYPAEHPIYSQAPQIAYQLSEPALLHPHNVPANVQLTPGSKGFSTYTIRTSKGSATALSIY